MATTHSSSCSSSSSSSSSYYSRSSCSISEITLKPGEVKEIKETRSKNIRTLVFIELNFKPSEFWPNTTGEVTFADAEGNCFWIGDQQLWMGKFGAENNKYVVSLGKVLTTTGADGKIKSATIDIADDEVNTMVCEDKKSVLETDDDVRKLIDSKAVMIDVETLAFMSGARMSRVRSGEETPDMMWRELRKRREAKIKANAHAAAERKATEEMKTGALPMAINFLRTDPKLKDWVRKFLEVLKATDYKAVDDHCRYNEQLSHVANVTLIRTEYLQPVRMGMKPIVDMRQGDWSNRSHDNSWIAIFGYCNNPYYLHKDNRIHLSTTASGPSYNEKIHFQFPNPPVTWISKNDYATYRLVALSIADLESALTQSCN